MPPRKYSKEQRKVAKVNPRVILPIPYDAYRKIALDQEQFRHWLDEMIAQYPELFPKEIAGGYRLHDILPASAKLLRVRFRRIKLKAVNASGKHQVLTICSSEVMPYMTGLTNDSRFA